MSKPILFCDYDGTICFDRYWRSLPVDKYKQVQEILFGDDRSVVQSWMRGGTNAEMVNRQLAEKIGVPYDDLWQLFVADCSTMRVNVATLEKLNALRTTYTTVLMTGNMDSFSRFTSPSLKLDQYFDYISNSFYEKKHKTDNNGELFLEWCQKSGATMDTAILFDDQATVCDIFTARGGTAYLVDVDKKIDTYLDELLLKQKNALKA